MSKLNIYKLDALPAFCRTAHSHYAVAFFEHIVSNSALRLSQL